MPLHLNQSQVDRLNKNIASPTPQEARSESTSHAVTRKPRKRSTRASKPSEPVQSAAWREGKNRVWVEGVKWGQVHRFTSVDKDREVTYCGHEVWIPTTLSVTTGTEPKCRVCFPKGESDGTTPHQG